MYWGINSRRAARSSTGAAGKGAKRKLYRSRREGGPSLADLPRLSPGRRWPESGRQWSGGNLASSAYRGPEGAFDGPVVPTSVRGQKAAASPQAVSEGHIPEGVPF